jgi:hypothetical protein
VPIRLRLPGLPKIKTIQVATPYPTFEELCVGFARFCEPDACFVPSTQTRPVGLEAVFSIQLATGEPVLRGTCTVLATYSRKTSPFGRAGLRLGITELTKDCRARYAQLLAAGIPQPVENEATVKTEVEPEYSSKPTVAMEPMKRTERGFVPLRQPAAPMLPLKISSAPTKVPRGLFGRLRDAIIRLYRSAVQWRPPPSLQDEATQIVRLRSTSR